MKRVLRMRIANKKLSAILRRAEYFSRSVCWRGRESGTRADETVWDWPFNHKDGDQREGVDVVWEQTASRSLARYWPALVWDWLASALMQGLPTVLAFLRARSPRGFLLCCLSSSFLLLEKNPAFMAHSPSYWLEENEGGAARVRGGLSRKT